jgi:hypothetical protein
MNDDTPIDVDLLQDWLQHVATRLSDALEDGRVHGERLDHIIGLLISMGTSKDGIVALLPDNVMESRRKLLGPARTPGLLDRRRDVQASRRSGARVESNIAAHGGSLLAAARSRLGNNAQQSAVLERVLLETQDGDGSLLSPTDLKRALDEEGLDVPVKTVRRYLNHLVDVGFLTHPHPGRYALSAEARAELAARTTVS